MSLQWAHSDEIPALWLAILGSFAIYLLPPVRPRSIGSVKDAVFVLRASDGTQVFRRHVPMYSRSTVVFCGREFFAY